MTTENQSSVVQLYRDTKTYVLTKHAGTSVVFGRKERWMQINQGSGGANRIIFVPGRVPGGEDGELGGADGPGPRLQSQPVPRILYLQSKIVTVCMWAADTTNDPSGSVDEAAQEEAIEQMFEWVQRAVRKSLAGAANVIWSATRYNADPNELRFGIEYLAELAVGTQYFDDVPGVAFPSGAAVTGELTS